ncbi:TPA: molybdopterin biosynthesis protein, partial [Candidatus Bathyarchaeota archaeon]|nr:molybdopterin biosynthesis protein [Candidatus Bathyarchaeota archaeon]
MGEGGELFRRLIPPEEARRRLLGLVTLAPRIERVGLFDALGRVCAMPIRSPIDVPPFDKSSVDGYAVRAEDTFGASEEDPVSLRLIGSVEIGRAPPSAISRGECMSVPTGAPLPKGADSAVMVEDTTRADEAVRVYRPVTPGENVMAKGFDVRRGQEVVGEDGHRRVLVFNEANYRPIREIG